MIAAVVTYLAIGCVIAALRIDWAFLTRPSTHHNVFIGTAGTLLTVLFWPFHAAETIRCVQWCRRNRLTGGRRCRV